MRLIFTALAFALSLLLPSAASADTYQYTLAWNASIQPNFPVYSAFNGVYTFSTNEAVTSPTIIYGPSYTPTMNGPFNYVYAPDLIAPSTVEFQTIELNPITQAIYLKISSSAYSNVPIFLTQSPSDPNVFQNFGGQASYNISLTIDDVGPTPAQTPEPSSFILLGSGIAALTAGIKHRRLAS